MTIPADPASEPQLRTLSNWKFVLAYDGTDFQGWQVQPSAPTIQGELAAAIQRITGESVLPQGSGRTDAGVHARAQVASCMLAAPIPPANFVRALNRTLPVAIRVLSAEVVPDTFHARHSAVSKTYEYRVCVVDPFAGAVCPPWDARFVYAMERPLDIQAMQEAATVVKGTHDFTSFAAFDPDRAQRMQSEPVSVSNIRTITRSEWTSHDGLLFVYRVSGDGFLHHMVRNLVGTFLEIGLGEREAGNVTAIIDARQRGAAGRTAPARGLFLDRVDYGDTPLQVLR